MLPTPTGSIIVGQKVESLDDVKQDAACIVVSRNEGIVYKRLSRNPKAKSKVTLVSDNPSYQPYNVNAEDILEMWQAQMVITKVAQQQRWDVGQLANLVTNLQEQVSTMKKRMN
jgi:predicted alpha/beta hydrolase family esterase